MIKIIKESVNNDIFDLTRADGSMYTELMPGNEENEYYKEYKNLIGEIVYMTPKEYFENCVKYCFPDSSVEKLYRSRDFDKESTEYLKKQIKSGNKLSTPYIDIANGGQEGLHRMLVCGQLYGWDDVKFPVLVVKYFDEDRHAQAERNRKLREINWAIEKVVKNIIQCEYVDTDELYSEIDYQIERAKDYDNIDLDWKVPQDNTILIYSITSPSECSQTINMDEIKFVDKHEELDSRGLEGINFKDIDWSDVDDAFIADLFK